MYNSAGLGFFLWVLFVFFFVMFLIFWFGFTVVLGWFFLVGFAVLFLGDIFSEFVRDKNSAFYGFLSEVMSWILKCF